MTPAQDWRHGQLAPEVWLLCERPDDGADEKYFFIHLPRRTALAQLVALAHQRWPIEQYQQLKTELDTSLERAQKNHSSLLTRRLAELTVWRTHLALWSPVESEAVMQTVDAPLDRHGFRVGVVPSAGLTTPLPLCLRHPSGRGLLAILIFVCVSRMAAAQGTFSPTGSMLFERNSFTLTRLDDGRVLAAGSNNYGNVGLASAEVYDPVTGIWSLTSSMNAPRGFHTATLLKNGKVLVVGGSNATSFALRSAELYDSVTGTWSLTGSLSVPRTMHTAFPLKDGRVLVTGGYGDSGPQATAEIYDPQTGQWSPTGSMVNARYVFQGVLLLDGRVLVAGGIGGGSASEIYDATTGSWSATGPMNFPRITGCSLTRLADGRLLLAGGDNRSDAEIFVPATGVWTLTTSMPRPSVNHSTALLLDGTILVTGSTGGADALIFSPALQTWTRVAGSFPQLNQAVRLLDGRVLVAGGSFASTHSAQAFLFTGGAGTVLPLLTLDVSAPSALPVVNGSYAPNPFTVTATLANTGAATAQNVDLSLSLPQGLTLAEGAPTQLVADVPAGQQRQVVWSVRAAGQKQDVTRSYFVTAVLSNGTGNTVSRQITLPGGALTISSITPKAGGETGPVTIHVNGGGILGGAMVKLVHDGELDISATAVSVAPDGFSVSATFDLAGKPRGFWSVLVTNPNGTGATLTDAFTVEAARAADVWGEIIGPSTMITGRLSTFFLEYGNRGNNNVYDVALFLRIPKNVPFSVRPLLPTATAPPPEVSVGVEEGAETLIPIWIYSVPAGASGVLVFTIAPQIAGVFPIKAEILQPPVSQFSRTGDFAFTPFHVDLMAQELAKALVPLITFTNISSLSQAGASSISAKSTDICEGLDPDTCRLLIDPKLEKEAVRELRSVVNPADVGIHIGFTFLAAAACVGVPISLPVCVAALVAEGAWASIEILAAGQATQRLLTARNAAVISPPPPGGGGRSSDPNDKVGAQGFGDARFVTGNTPVSYEILFENLEIATAPAHEIAITDQLNVGALDLATFSLGPISFGDTLAVPPAGLTQYTTDVDLRPANNLIVRINAGLDAATGLATWHFVSLDPATMLPPDNSQIGFLPPNVHFPEGQGSVLFTVTPIANLPTGLEVRNQATILFDTNDPIDTPRWFNTIDNDKPLSYVAPLPPTTTSTDFLVQWVGADFGSGIQDFTIFVSDDGGPFTPFQTNTSSTSAMFSGQSGHTYAFYSIARDLVENVEGAKSVAEAITQVVVDSTPPLIVPHTAGTLGKNDWYTSNVTVTWDVTDHESGIALSSGCIATTLTAETNGVTLTCSATNGAGLSSSVPVTIKLDKTPPMISGTRSPTQNGNAWNSSPVTVSFQCSDSLSGLAAGSPPPPTILSTEGVGKSAIGTCSDVAGNSASAAVRNINIDLTPPVITLAASSSTLWPPNGKLMPDVISGKMSDALSGVDPSTAMFQVVDEYSLVQPAGGVTLMPDGSYSVTLRLEASRLGQDLDGRHYQIVVTVADRSGNRSSASTFVIVPHDQRK